jgi:hypothetical protein
VAGHHQERAGPLEKGDIILTEKPPEGLSESQAIDPGVKKGPVPFLKAKELEAIGYNLVIYPVAATYAAAKAVTGLMEELKRTGTTAGFSDRMWQFNEFSEFIGLEEFRRQERRYLDEGIAAASAPQKDRKRRGR